MNVQATQSSKPSAAAIKKLGEISLRVRTPNIAHEIWHKALDDHERARLGGDLESAYRTGGSVAIWASMHGCTQVRAVIDVAHTVNLLTSQDRRWLLNETCELLDAEAAYEDAILKNQLVLNSLQQEIYWQGEQIKFDWASHEAKWWFMWELARHAKADLPIDYTVFGERKNLNYVSKTKSAITNLDCFPSTLAVLIESIGTGAQKLLIAAEEIRLFERHIAGEIREWLP